MTAARDMAFGIIDKMRVQSGLYCMGRIVPIGVNALCAAFDQLTKADMRDAQLCDGGGCSDRWCKNQSRTRRASQESS